MPQRTSHLFLHRATPPTSTKSTEYTTARMKLICAGCLKQNPAIHITFVASAGHVWGRCMFLGVRACPPPWASVLEPHRTSHLLFIPLPPPPPSATSRRAPHHRRSRRRSPPPSVSSRRNPVDGLSPSLPHAIRPTVIASPARVGRLRFASRRAPHAVTAAHDVVTPRAAHPTQSPPPMMWSRALCIFIFNPQHHHSPLKKITPKKLCLSVRLSVPPPSPPSRRSRVLVAAPVVAPATLQSLIRCPFLPLDVPHARWTGARRPPLYV